MLISCRSGTRWEGSLSPCEDTAVVPRLVEALLSRGNTHEKKKETD